MQFSPSDRRALRSLGLQCLAVAAGRSRDYRGDAGLSVGYQKRDHEIVDYKLFRLADTGLDLRGPLPRPLEPGKYFACLGAAQTFGCFVEHPYPALLANRIGIASLNLGIAGAGPRYFVRTARLLPYINASRFAIVQIMSARSEDNSRLLSDGLEQLTVRADGRRLGAEPAYRELMADLRRSELDALVAETRANWVASFRELLASITVPVVLFWFSKRSPRYQLSYHDVHALFGEFPQLVDERMVLSLIATTASYVECITSRGSPQRLVSRFSGRPVSVLGRADLGREFGCNTYYPSPEMHVDAAACLSEPCKSILTEMA